MSDSSCPECGRSTVEPPFHHPDCKAGRGTTWHRTIYSRGDLAYSHLHAAASAGHVELALHLDADHGVTPSAAGFGSWCRDVEAHAAAHGVTVRPS